MGSEQRLEETGECTYSRMFAGGHHQPFREDTLHALAEQMRSSAGRQSDQTPAGVVYFGQFIDHDITRDETTLACAGEREPEKTRNHRTPHLDLDSLYDGARGTARNWLDATAPGAERFHIGPTAGTDTHPPLPADLYRPDGKIAALADDRNDENLIIAQWTVLFMKLHNRLLRQLDEGDEEVARMPGETPFQKVRCAVTWYYQWLVVNVFLRHVLLPRVWREVFEDDDYVPFLGFNPKPGAPVQLPVEFAMAAFRFGHSMVRNAYKLNRTTPNRRLATLLRREPSILVSSDVIEWPLFLDLNAGANRAERIDTQMAVDLYALPSEVVSLFTAAPAGPLRSLPERTLVRGSRVGLPSAQDALSAFRGRVPEYPVIAGDHLYDFLHEHGLIARTPLWFYLLHEAAVAGSTDPGALRLRRCGACLGPFGSRIVAEVFLGLLGSDESSYWHRRGKWQPTKFRSLSQLADFAAA